MGKIHKGLFLVVAVLVLSNLIVTASAQFSTPTSNPQTPSSSPTASTPTPPPTPTPPTPAITYPKPSVPEFSLTLSVSPSGNKTIELTVKNQAFVPYRDASGVTIYMVYNVRASTNSGNWTELYNAEDGYPQPSNSSYTAFTYAVENSSYTPDILVGGRMVGIYPSDGQVNFQVQAMIGYRARGPLVSPLNMPYVFNGEKSGWSNTQTINLNEVTNSPTPTIFSPPRNPPHLEPIDYLLPIGIVLVVVIVISMLIYKTYKLDFLVKKSLLR